MVFIEYTLISGLINIISIMAFNLLSGIEAKKLGYIFGFPHQSIVKSIFQIIKYFIPIYSSINALCLVIFSILLKTKSELIDPILIESLDNSDLSVTGVDNIKKYLATCDKEQIKDSMIIDGADKKQINIEIKKAEMEISQYAFNLPEDSDKRKKELDAMTYIEDWLDAIDVEVGLSQHERKILYLNYIKDFCSENRDKALKKTMRLINKRK